MLQSHISLNITNEDRDLINKVCKLRGEDLSSFVRRAIYKHLAELGFLSKERKQALGLDGIIIEGN